VWATGRPLTLALSPWEREPDRPMGVAASRASGRGFSLPLRFLALLEMTEWAGLRPAPTPSIQGAEG